MTCDYIVIGQRCGEDEEVQITVFHPNHDNYIGEPESPFELQLCAKHQNKKVSWKMIQETNRILLESGS